LDWGFVFVVVDVAEDGEVDDADGDADEDGFFGVE